MTTGILIKLLQKEDPNGTSHVRLGGGVPIYVQLKEGYWDGPYNYINEDGKWVHSTQNCKVDIICKEPEDMLENFFDTHNPWTDSYENLWTKAKDLFVFNLTYSDKGQRNERVDNYLKPIKEHFDWYVIHHKETWEKDLKKVIELYQNGCRFFRQKETSMKYYTGWKFLNGGCANLAHTYPILDSGRFEAIEVSDDLPFESEGVAYYEYKLKK